MLGANGRYEESVNMLRENLAIADSLLGNSPMKAALTRRYLALSLMNLGKKDEARKEIREALTVVRELLPIEHIDRIAIEKTALKLGIKASEPTQQQVKEGPQNPPSKLP